MKPGDIITYKGHPAMIHSIGQYHCLDAFHDGSNLVRKTDELTIYVFDEYGGYFTRIIKDTGVYSIDVPDAWKQTHPERRRLDCHPSVISSATSAALSTSTESASKDLPALDSPRLTIPEESASTSAQPTVSSNSQKSEEAP